MGAKGVFFDSLWVDEPSGQRWKLALELLTEGKGFVFGGTGLSLGQANDVLVTVPSRFRFDLEKTAEAVVMSQLQEAKKIVHALVEESQEFSTMVKGRTFEYQLVEDLYGFPIFSLRDGVFRRLR
jgi:hypothetical protein